MATELMAFELPGFEIGHIGKQDGGLEIEAEASRQWAMCPKCGWRSRAIHSHYQRWIQDLPISGQAVWLKLRVRRFRCRNQACPQRIFAERLPDLVASHARYSGRLKAILTRMGLLVGGQTGSRLAQLLRITCSADTLLRLIRQHGLPLNSTPRVLGVDDWALAKGRRYGTLLVDLERSVPVDVLPDRTAQTLAHWLKLHPGIEILTRDRFSEYAQGASEGAPACQQVADRWHLLKNLRDALERLLRRFYSRLRALPGKVGPWQQSPARPRRLRSPSANEQVSQEASRFRRYRLYRAIHYLLARGLSQRYIAGLLNVDRATVRIYAEAETFPERVPSRPRASILDPHLAYLSQRWQAGCTNASQLCREIRERGYQGSYQQVARWAHHQRQPARAPNATPDAAPLPVVSTPALPAPRYLVWLLLRSGEQLSDHETLLLNQLRQDAQFAQAHDLAQQFHQMVRLRQPGALAPWLHTCSTCDLPDLREFAAALLRDVDAVRNALTYPSSNGPVEGHICRLKLIKRTMYGRAK